MRSRRSRDRPQRSATAQGTDRPPIGHSATSPIERNKDLALEHEELIFRALLAARWTGLMPGEIGEQTGLPARTVSRVVRRLEDQGRVVRETSRGRVWPAPEVLPGRGRRAGDLAGYRELQRADAVAAGVQLVPATVAISINGRRIQAPAKVPSSCPHRPLAPLTPTPIGREEICPHGCARPENYPVGLWRWTGRAWAAEGTPAAQQAARTLRRELGYPDLAATAPPSRHPGNDFGQRVRRYLDKGGYAPDEESAVRAGLYRLPREKAEAIMRDAGVS